MKERDKTGIMFENRNKIIEARGGYRLSEREMDVNGIRGIYNAAGDISQMDYHYIQGMINRVVQGIETVLVETAIRQRVGWSSPVKVVSLIVFQDEWSVNLYIMRNSKIFIDAENLRIMN